MVKPTTWRRALQVTEIFTSHVGLLLEEHAADPATNWHAKDAAIYIVTSLAVRSSDVDWHSPQIHLEVLRGGGGPGALLLIADWLLLGLAWLLFMTMCR